MLKTTAILFGIIFLAIGTLGFIPVFSPDSHLLGVFRINSTHNLVHIVTGVAAAWCGIQGMRASRIFFRVIGVAYALVAILGFVYGDRDIFGYLASNPADTWLHGVTALISLYLGFAE